MAPKKKFIPDPFDPVPSEPEIDILEDAEIEWVEEEEEKPVKINIPPTPPSVTTSVVTNEDEQKKIKEHRRRMFALGR